MPFPAIPVVLGAGTLYAWLRVRSRQKMTPERKKAFEEAIKAAVKPEQVAAHVEKLHTLADIFDKEGLRAEGSELRKRAKILELPPEKKSEYRQAYKDGLSASDPDKVKNLATAFHEKGFYGSAKNLRDYAAGLVKNLTAKLPEKVQSEPASPFAPEVQPAAPPVEEPKAPFVPNEALEVENASSNPDSPVSDGS